MYGTMEELKVSLVSSVSPILTRRGRNRGQSCMKKEIWRPVIGYENNYVVSNLARIKNTRSLRMLKPINSRGYTLVSLCKNGIIKSTRIHRIVALAFIPNPHNKPFINHKNGNKNDNSIENLEWCTYKENLQHSWDTGLRKKKSATGEKFIYFDRLSYRIIKDYVYMGSFGSLKEAVEKRDSLKLLIKQTQWNCKRRTRTVRY